MVYFVVFLVHAVCASGMNLLIDWRVFDAGYVGYEEGGQLTEAVRRKPYQVSSLQNCRCCS